MISTPRTAATALTMALVLAAMAPAASAAQSGGGMYLGGMFNIGIAENANAKEASNPVSGTFLIGTKLNPSFLLEGRASLGLATGEAPQWGGGDLETKLKHAVGGYGRYLIPVSPTMDAYGLFGATYGRVATRSVPGGRWEAMNDLSPSLGFGLDIKVSPGFGIMVEYASLMDNGAWNYDAISVGFVGRF